MDGLPNRFSQEERILMEGTKWNGGDFVGRNGRYGAIGRKASDAEVGAPDFVFWGDSHGLMMAGVGDRVAAQQRLRGDADEIKRCIAARNERKSFQQSGHRGALWRCRENADDAL